jgi:hypothetical protein
MRRLRRVVELTPIAQYTPGNKRCANGSEVHRSPTPCLSISASATASIIGRRTSTNAFAGSKK